MRKTLSRQILHCREQQASPKLHYQCPAGLRRKRCPPDDNGGAFVRLMYEDLDRDTQNIAPLAMPSAAYPASLKRGTLTWFRELEAFCNNFERNVIDTRDVILKSNENVLLEHDVCVTLLTSQSITAFLDENPQLSTQLKIEHLNSRILSRLENELMGKEIRYSPEEKKALTRFYRQYFGPKKWKYSTYGIYSDFLKSQEKNTAPCSLMTLKLLIYMTSPP